MKSTILHVIVNLNRGGAETTLVNVLKELKDYNNIVVTLQDQNQFENELQCDKYISLKKSSLFLLLPAAFQLRRIIKENKVDLVHSQLALSNFVARLATPSKIPLVTTIQNSIRTSKDYRKKYIRIIDKFTFNLKKSTIIGCSKTALNDYFSILHLKPFKSYVLYNFVNNKAIARKDDLKAGDIFRVICVASLSVQKNLFYLVEAFAKLKSFPVELHIYGDGPLKNQLFSRIYETKAPVILKGLSKDINMLLPEYDAYVMSSLYEGFSLSVLEAMAGGLPLLLSDISSFREQCGECAVYFNLNNPDDFEEKLQKIFQSWELRMQMSECAFQRVVNNYTLDHHMEGLRKIYLDALEKLSATRYND